MKLQYYEIEVTLQEISPHIWRRFLIPRIATFADLHQAIQDSMGWQDYHLWEFTQHMEVQKKIAGLPDEAYEDEPTPDATMIKLSSYFDKGSKADRCIYIYDYGDYWLHEVVLNQVVQLEDRFARRLLAGGRACPPEDCGSTPGYERLVEFLKTGNDPYGESEADLKEWIRSWDPEAFNVMEWKKAFDR
jgi:hypothetical protein